MIIVDLDYRGAITVGRVASDIFLGKRQLLGDRGHILGKEGNEIDHTFIVAGLLPEVLSIAWYWFIISSIVKYATDCRVGPYVSTSINGYGVDPERPLFGRICCEQQIIALAWF